MRIKKPLLIAGAITSVGLAGVAGLGVASAATPANNTGNDSLVDKIASTFNLDKSKVQAVFDSNRQEKEAKHQATVEKQLDKLVTDGKLTSAQKDAILAKLKDVQTQRENDRQTAKDKTASERKTYMEQQKAALEQWAKDNNIPTKYLRFVLGGPGHHGMGGPGMQDTDTSSGAGSQTTTN